MVSVNHKVKSQNLKAHVIGVVVGLGCAVLVLQMWLTSNQCFYDYVLYIAPVILSLVT
jgi:hypothetical protein